MLATADARQSGGRIAIERWVEGGDLGRPHTW